MSAQMAGLEDEESIEIGKNIFDSLSSYDVEILQKSENQADPSSEDFEIIKHSKNQTSDS